MRARGRPLLPLAEANEGLTEQWLTLTPCCHASLHSCLNLVLVQSMGLEETAPLNISLLQAPLWTRTRWDSNRDRHFTDRPQHALALSLAISNLPLWPPWLDVSRRKIHLVGSTAQGQGFVLLSFIIALISALSRCLGPLMQRCEWMSGFWRSAAYMYILRIRKGSAYVRQHWLLHYN